MVLKRILLFSLVFRAGLVGTVVSQDWAAVEIKATQVSGNVYMLQGQGGNIGVTAGPDGVLIVDDQFAPLAGKIQQALTLIRPGKLKFVLNTHWHGDHTGGNQVFGPEATIIAHTNVRRRLSAEQNRNGQITPSSPPAAWPVITFDESLSIHFNGEEIRAMHYPTGHTDGDSIIVFTESKVVHMGDHFFRDRFPFVDIASGGDALGLLENVGNVIAEIEKMGGDVKIIPGHGVLSTLPDLRRYHEMLTETIQHVRQGMRDELMLDGLKERGLDAKFASWGTGFINQDRWIEFVYHSLRR